MKTINQHVLTLSGNSRHVSKLLAGSGYLALVCFLAILALRILMAFSPNTNLAGIEPNVIYTIQLFLDDTQSLYSNPQAPPFSITQYTPLYYLICGLTAKLFQLSPLTDITQIYLAGRLWNIVFNLISAGAVLLIAFRLLFLARPLALLTAACSFAFLYPHNAAVRPDSLLDVLVLWSFCCFMYYLKNREALYMLVASAVLATVAVFAKQSGIQAPAILIFFLVISRNWRGFLYFLVVSAASIGMLFLFCWLGYGPYFFQNVVGGLDNGISLNWFIRWIWGLNFLFKILLPALLLTGIYLYRRFIFKASEEVKFLAVAAAGTFAFATLTGLKTGATIQYYVIFQNLGILLLLYFFFRQRVKTASSKAEDATYLPPFMLLGYLLFLQSHSVLAHYQKLDYHSWPAIAAENNKALEVAVFLQKQLRPGESVFANLDMHDRSLLNNLLFRHCVVPQLDIITISNKPIKVFGYQNLAEQLKNGSIRYLIESKPTNSFGHTNIAELANPKANYLFLTSINGYKIYQYASMQKTNKR